MPNLLHVGQFMVLNLNFREYGELLVSCGLIGEAVQIFEELELWDNLIFCYRYGDCVFNNQLHLYLMSTLLFPVTISSKFIKLTAY